MSNQALYEATARLLMILTCVGRDDLRQVLADPRTKHQNPGEWANLPTLLSAVGERDFSEFCRTFQAQKGDNPIVTALDTLKTRAESLVRWNPATPCAPNELIEAMLRGVRDHLGV